MKRSLLDFACVVVPKGIGGVGLLCCNLTLIRFLSPKLFGAYSLCLTIILLLSEGLLGAAIDLSVLRFAPVSRDTDPKRSLDIERTALWFKVVVAGVLSAVLISISSPLSEWLFQGAGTARLIWITCAAILGMLMFGSALVHAQIRGNFVQYAALDSLQLLLRYGGIGAVLLWTQYRGGDVSVSSVLIWFAVGPLGAFLVFLATAEVSIFRLAIPANSIALELLDYGKWFLVTFAASALVMRVDVFLLKSLATIDSVGIYTGGQAIASIPLLAGSYLGVVLSPKVMPYLSEGRLYGFLCKVQIWLFLASVLLCLAAVSSMKLIAERVFPPAFAPSVTVLQLLLPGTLAGMSGIPLVLTFVMFVRPRFLFVLDVLMLPALLLAYVLCISRYSAAGAAAVTSVFMILKTVIAVAAAFHWARQSSRELSPSLPKSAGV